ncbi:PTR2-domain-containing protein [Rhodotorula diobovata]|uniref:PTR2-domain-containing protein n=1 Tax=Rhodotorula diobovata TaxID=5288 RepID=A0A5C5FUM3_9BASI|nr:PTR2-domain-containing protein [Rhodotorula diobovata]
MSGLDPNEASFQAIAHEIDANTEMNTGKDKDGFVFDEKRAVSPASDPTEAYGEHPDAPTEEEKRTLRRVPGPINIGAFLVAYVELAERFSYYGCTVVFTNFIQRDLPPGSTTGATTGPDQQAGALGMGQQASTGLTTFNQFWVYCVPLFGAYIADTYLGRYTTICWAIVVALIGHVLLVAAAAPSVIANSNVAIGVFALAIIIMGAGTGMFKSNVSPLIAEQVASHPTYVKTLKDGTRVIVDPAQTTARMYNWFYMAINVGALAGQLGMSYAARNHGYWLAYLLPTLVFATTPLVMWLGRNRYVRVKPAGSVLGKAMRILSMGFKNAGWSPRSWYRAGFWESALPSRIPVAERPSWMVWDDTFVWEVRRGFKACQVFGFFPLYWLTYNQINNNLTSQAAVMNTHGLPNDVLSNLDPFALLILIPLMDLFIYPALRRAGINFSPVKKIFAGFMCGSLAMMCAAVVQHEIYKRSVCGHNAATCEEEPFIESLNVWIQTPSYILIALSEIFASIVSLEYAYTKAPKSMRSMVMSVGLFTTAISAAIGEAFLPLSADPLLVANYGVMAGLAFVGGIAFYATFWKLDQEERSLNEIAAGEHNAEVAAHQRAEDSA